MSEGNSELIERIAKKFSQCNGTDPQIVRALREFERHIHVRILELQSICEQQRKALQDTQECELYDKSGCDINGFATAAVEYALSMQPDISELTEFLAWRDVHARTLDALLFYANEWEPGRASCDPSDKLLDDRGLMARRLLAKMNFVFPPETAPEREPGAPAARAFNASGGLTSNSP